EEFSDGPRGLARLEGRREWGPAHFVLAEMAALWQSDLSDIDQPCDRLPALGATGVRWCTGRAGTAQRPDGCESALAASGHARHHSPRSSATLRRRCRDTDTRGARR